MAVNVLILDRAMADVWFAGQVLNSTTAKSVKDWCTEQNADLCFNLGMFQMITDKKGKVIAGKGCTYVNAKGHDIGYGGASDILILNSTNRCKGYSNGIINNTVKINAGLGGSRTRNGIGLTVSGSVILAQSSTNMTERGFCEAVLNTVKARKQSVQLFVLQDGGGSTSEYSARSKLNFAPEGGRVVTTVTCVKFKTLPKINRPLYKGCVGNGENMLLQMLLGGIEVDDSYGVGTGKRVSQAYPALGFPAALQTTVAWSDLLKKLGLQ